MAGKRSEVRRLLAELEGRSRREYVPSLRRAQLAVQHVAVAQRMAAAVPDRDRLPSIH